MAPLADAMRFVNRKQTQVPLRIQIIELCQKAWRSHALRCGIEQCHIASAHALLDRVGIFATQTGI